MCGGQRLNGKIWGGPGKDGAHMTASESCRGEHLIGWERGLYKLKDLISMTMSCHRIRDMFLPHEFCCYHNTKHRPYNSRVVMREREMEAIFMRSEHTHERTSTAWRASSSLA